MSIRTVRSGELLAFAGGVCVVVSLFVAAYEGSTAGTLDGWDTFGPAVALLLAAAGAALWLLLATLTERGTALPVAAAVWCLPLGLIAVVSALVRLLERPDHATRVGAGPWLALAGALAILIGSWRSIRDERRSLYPSASPSPRPRP
jgi:hypothetical protein